MRQRIEIDGDTLALEQIEQIARGEAEVALAGEARERVLRSRAVVEAAVEGGRVVYGVTTGFGRLSEVAIPREHLAELQLNLIRSHACGVGQPLPREETRAITLLRANVLAKGFSGVRPVVIERLLRPAEPRRPPRDSRAGFRRRSGDLAPLAHLALVLIGEGEAEVGGVRMPGGEALARFGLAPLALQAKEGLALINGTQVHDGASERWCCWAPSASWPPPTSRAP